MYSPSWIITVQKLTKVKRSRGPVKPSVDKVNSAVGKHNEGRNLIQQSPPASCLLVHVIVKFRVAVEFQQEPRHGQQDHDRDRRKRLLDFQRHLVLEVSWVVEIGFVVNKVVRCSGNSKVQDPSKNGHNDKQRDGLSD
ncbi:hypothetical protein OGAPHI_001778 [Ogataea philodendri]|uniref:Uncharacterized protein n=1 Tax=Ogataea philodendri TaxID=1378263 RepID=A0A9P8PB46_9ASCO|nr:uncharacterized protein OGAPHI_001778 [Ogataea philodendri]KAH3668024.1 hypothetical protein OGAPHI_001778 [Ogataea philodendri]